MDKKVTRVQLSILQIHKRHRAIDKFKVASLAKSMDAIGLQTPISVHVLADVVHLVAGHHRVMAAKSLGWEHIDGIVVELDEVVREIWEIDENLQRAGLSKAEEREHFKRRKELWQKHQSAHRAPIESKRADGKGHRPKSFAADTAAATGRSKSQINRILAEPKPKKPKVEKPKEKPASDSPDHTVYGTPLAREPKLDTRAGIAVFRDCYLEKCAELHADIDLEIELVTARLRKIAGNGAEPNRLDTPLSNIPPTAKIGEKRTDVK